MKDNLTFAEVGWALFGALLLALIGVYLIFGSSLGWNPSNWGAEINRQQLQAERAEWDIVCRRPRP
jgi:hypothetical protein